ncbi:NADPH:quinone reductase [Bryocella elongata]|uniref:NADPH:quinone reductase n=1 Tax=Bryocella elongata TaxID=863522 RepID=A0A1H5ZMJ4_9BACT|nr:NADP-dependent oxidoreductase [Bryocella elongata]SEG36975.1 NADPH:quinone reductase [Bryocella elongata]
MKALEFVDAATDVRLVQTDRERPAPGDGELLIRVRAAGIIPTERLWYPTLCTQDGVPRRQVIPAHEFAGEVVEDAGGSRGFKPGDLIFGMNGWFKDGALAEYTLAVPGSLAKIPPGISLEQAASVPISALTAWQGLYERANVRAGERVLVLGAAGAVGLYAVQLAAIRGAKVVATLSAQDFAVVEALGASQLIDYRSQRFEELAGPVDVIFDTVGGDSLERSWSLLKPGGRVITIASSSGSSTDPRTREAFLLVKPISSQLSEMAGWLHAGRLKAFVKSVVPFSEAKSVFSGTEIPGSRRLGKIVVTTT